MTQSPPPVPLIIGITGNIGSGKSTVANRWLNENIQLIEGDALGREVVEQSDEFRQWLRNEFGEEIFDGDNLKRAEFGRMVFADAEARDKLNAAIWPYIRHLLHDYIKQALNAGESALVDAAMIFEWGDQDRYDVIVAVVSDPYEGARRAAKRMGLTTEEMMQRYRMQIPAEEKARRSDFVLRSSNADKQILLEAADAIWPEVIRVGTERAKRRNP